MRRLQVLPCPESWARMRPDGDGRYCDRCQLRVTDVAQLDGEGLEELLAAAARGRVCAHFELEGGRPRTKLGFAAGLMVVALAGCAAPGAGESQSPIEESAMLELLDDGSDPTGPGARISGIVRSPEGLPIANAVVVLQSVALPGGQERYTNEHGVYKFGDLPPGNYTIQVLAGKASSSKITTLPENARFRANFMLDPDADLDGMIGLVSEESMIDTSSPASTYSSRLLEYE